MIHRVVREVDRGEPLVVREVEIREEDSLQDVEGRIHEMSLPLLYLRSGSLVELRLIIYLSL